MRAAQLSDRARSWLMFAIVFNVAMTLMVVWALYAATHIQSRYTATEPGAVVTIDEVEYRLIKLTRTEVMVDGGESVPSDAGTSWVVAEVEVTIPRKMEYFPCSAQLLAAGNSTWETWDTGFYDRKLPQYCDEPKPRKPYRFEQVFQIPNDYVDRIDGVFIEDETDAAPVPVMRI